MSNSELSNLIGFKIFNDFGEIHFLEHIGNKFYIKILKYLKIIKI